MDINSLFGFDRGANKEAADYARQNDGQISINPLQRLFGADDSDVQNILNRENQKGLNSTYGAALALAGRGGAEWGESESSIQGRIASGQRQMEANKEGKLRKYKSEDNAAALKNATTLKGMDLQAGRDQYLHSSNQQTARYAHERGENRMDRRHQSELADGSNDLQMQMSIMQNDLSEKRMDYDRETRSMDKRDRAIATLMSGLGSLGGAFAL